mmetsp:Transcript_12699/g.28008  ORF Transcript_12699/g.28008 Transcript_12699/m.28008 type:complete len:192 (-) Transcript_12699:26-601(-)
MFARLLPPLLTVLASAAQEYGELGGSLSSEMFVRDLLGKSEADVERQRELEATFANFDHDGDGALNRTESWAWYRFLDEDGEDSEVTDQHRAAFLEFDEDHDEKFSKPEVAELLLCMDKVEAMKDAVDMEDEEDEEEEYEDVATAEDGTDAEGDSEDESEEDEDEEGEEEEEDEDAESNDGESTSSDTVLH